MRTIKHFALLLLASLALFVLRDATADEPPATPAGETTSDQADTHSGQDSIIESAVSIEFSEPEYSFTIALAAQGISLEYDVIVTRDIPQVVVYPEYANSQCSPGNSGFYVFEQLSGNEQRYCIADIGLGPPVSRELVTIREGSYQYAFLWDGRNWLGPSDTGNGKGELFPPGTCTLEISFCGEVATEQGREYSRITKQVEITLVE